MVERNLVPCDLSHAEQPTRIDHLRLVADICDPPMETISTASDSITILRTVSGRPRGRGDRGEPILTSQVARSVAAVEFDIVEATLDGHTNLGRLTIDIRERQGNAIAHVYFDVPSARRDQQNNGVPIEVVDAVERRLEAAGVAVCVVHTTNADTRDALEARGYWVTALQDEQPGHDVVGTWAFSRTLLVPRPDTLFASPDL